MGKCRPYLFESWFLQHLIEQCEDMRGTVNGRHELQHYLHLTEMYGTSCRVFLLSVTTKLRWLKLKNSYTYNHRLMLWKFNATIKAIKSHPCSPYQYSTNLDYPDIAIKQAPNPTNYIIHRPYVKQFSCTNAGFLLVWLIKMPRLFMTD